MLKSLDILIGFAAVMLFVSMGVTFLTQIGIQFCRSRGRHLVGGLMDILHQVDPKIPEEVARKIAGGIVNHPLIRGSRRRSGDVVRREELTSLLLQLATDPPAGADTKGLDAFQKLKTILETNGIPNPAETLKRVRLAALELEKVSPELSNSARQSAAILREASSDFIAKLNMHFDDVMDRVTSRFTYSTRLVTFVSAAIVAVALQLDAVSVINRLSTDEKMRDAFVQEAIRETPPAGATAAAGVTQADLEKQRQYFNFLAKAGIVNVPASIPEWFTRWETVSWSGIGLSILLLSLGAPFWHSTLSNLVRLRSVIAQKDDVERNERQTNTSAPAGSTSAPAPVAAAQGERGDIDAVG